MLDTEEWNKVGKVKADEEVRFTVFNFMFRKGFTEKEQFRKEHFLKEVKGQASNLKGSKPKHAWCVLRLANRPEWWDKNEWGKKNIKSIMMSFPGGTRGKEPGCQCRKYKRRGFDFLVGEIPGEGNGNPLQPPCLENPMDRGTWWATFYRVPKSQTQLKWLNMMSFLVKESEYRQYTWKADPIDI